MSVNSKMTAIADKIRSMLGITGIMGMDSMATNLGTVQTNLNSAFAAISNKGGTVPASKVSGNLVSAINSIPVGAMVQRTPEGATLTTDEDGLAVVNCGFQPDLVVMFVTDAGEGGDYYHLAFAFAALNEEHAVQCSETTEYMLYVQATRTATGFTIDWAGKWDFDWEFIGYMNQSFEYVAVKYT